MAKKDKSAKAPTPDEVEAIFSDVDETGHTNASKARKERTRRRARKAAVEVDPLSGDDPSGSNVGKTMTRAAVVVLIVLLVAVVVSQVACGLVRRAGTAQLAEHVDAASVNTALRNGVEWGDGFTQFPEDYTVLECLAGSQIQAAALSVNALLNPNINQVIYHVDVHVDDNGDIQQSSLFGFLKPTGTMKRFATFVWTKSTGVNGGFNFNCMITDLDATASENLREKVTLPTNILDAVIGDSAATTEAASTAEAVTAEAATEAAAE